MHRLGKDLDGQSVAHSHPAQFELITAGSRPRIAGAVPDSDPGVLCALADCMAAPFHFLYVLHTSRGEGELGRYQSPELSRQQVDGFLAKFAPFLSQDGRFDLWLYSPSDAATVVWDRHDQLFAYGPVECFAERLTQLGFTSGRPAIPAPHFHHYRSDLDSFARALLAEFDWHVTPLRDEDVQ